MITRQMKQALGEQNANLTWESGFERILSCMREHKMMLLHVYRSKSRNELLGIFERYGSTVVSHAIAQCASDMAINVSDQDLVYIMRMYVYVFIGVINRWMEYDMHLTPAYIASRCNAVMALSIRNALQKLSDCEELPLQMPEKVNRMDIPQAK